MSNVIKIVFLFAMGFILTGCASDEVVKYNPDDFINPNHVVTKQVPVHEAIPKVKATYGYGNDPQVVKAYDEFSKDGKSKDIDADGFVTLAYNRYSHPIIACEPLHLCVIQLEQGEVINDIQIGDQSHWLVSTARVGTANDGSYEVTLKPKRYNIATDIIITTDKRTYNIGLVSKRDAKTHVVTFYYPEETLQATATKAHDDETSGITAQTVSQSTNVALNHLNFNYKLKGDRPAWLPTRIFDDGDKTYIQMPPITERMDLPVLYIQKNKKLALVNYRYKQPYYIIDGLFQRAFLISGKGFHQEKVEIDNKNFG